MKTIFLLCLLLPVIYAMTMPSMDHRALFQQRQAARCSFPEFYSKAGVVRDAIAAISDADTLSDLYVRIANSFTQLDDYFGCFNAEPNKPLIIIEADEDVTIEDTIECPDEYKVDHPEDPCCYPRKLVDACCAPRTITYTETDKFQRFDNDEVEDKCRNPAVIKPFISKISSHLDFVDRGFCKVFLPTGEDIDRYFRPLAYCVHNVLGYGDAGKCTTDAGCFTNNCHRGHCVPDLEDLATPIIQCLTVGIPDDIERRLRRDWGFTHQNSDLEFRQRFLAEFAENGCIDLNADGADANLPTNENDCLLPTGCDCNIDGTDHCSTNNCYLPIGQLYNNPSDSRSICLAPDTATNTCPLKVCSNHNIPEADCLGEDHCDRPCANDAICADEASCVALGSCDDDELRDGVCVVPWVDREGDVFSCPDGDRKIRRGCVRESATDESLCTTAGGVWVTRATTEAECAAHGEICVDDVMRNFYTWRPNKWGRGRLLDLVDRPGNIAPLYRWDTKIKDVELGQVWGKAIARHVGQHFRVYLGCVMGPLIPVAALVACDCFDMPNRPANCFNGADIDANIDGGSAIVFALVAGCIRTASAKICWVQATIVVSNGKDSVILQVTFVSARILAIERNRKRAELGLRQAAGNEFNIVENDAMEVVGQVVGDEYAIQMDDPALLSGSFNLCLTPDDTIQIDAANDKVGFAFATESMGTPIYDPSIVVTVIGGDYCADISKPGYFTAVNVDSAKVGTGSGSGTSGAARMESAFF